MHAEATPRVNSRLSRLAWDLLADSMLALQRSTRHCRHCGCSAAQAAAMNEPICPARGRIDFHSYTDVPAQVPR